MRHRSLRAALAAGAAILLTPGPLFAQAAGDLETRLRDLEAQLAAVRAELAQQRQEAARARTDIETIQSRPAAAAPSAAPVRVADGFQVGDVTIKLGGFVKAEALATSYDGGDTATSFFGADFYLPSAIPVGQDALEESSDFEFHAKQTRLAVTASRTADGHTLTGYVEGDFQSAPGTQGSERTTNAYDFALRRATIAFDDWVFGQDWSTFMNVGALPEVADFIGPTEGTVFVRQGLVRYTRKLGANAGLALALENPETSYVTPSSATMVEAKDDQFPDFVARLNLKGDYGELSFAALARQLSAEDAAARFSAEAFGWGVTAGGKLKLGARDDLRFGVTGGEGVGRYVGLNLAPDGVLRAGDLEPVRVLAGFLAYRHMWSSALRSTLVLSAQDIDEDGLPGAASVSALSASANLFYTPVKGLDLGVELRHGQREIVSGADGSIDRVHLVAKQSF